MKSLPIAIIFLICLPVMAMAAAPDIPRLIDTDGPSQGVQSLTLQESWRVGGEDEEDTEVEPLEVICYIMGDPKVATP